MVLIFEAPSNEDVAAISMTVLSSGSISAAETTALMTAEEAMSAMKKAGKAGKTYVPPKGR